MKFTSMNSVVPLEAAPGVQSNVVLTGLAAVVPVPGVNVEPAGCPMTLSVRSLPGSAALSTCEKGVPIGSEKTPPVGQVGTGSEVISTNTSSAVLLARGGLPCVDSRTTWSTYCSPPTALVRSQVTLHWFGLGALTEGCDPSAGTAGTSSPRFRPDSAAVAKRQLTGSPSASNMRKSCVRTAPRSN